MSSSEDERGPGAGGVGLIDDLVSRTNLIARAAAEAVEGLDTSAAEGVEGGDLIATLVEQLHGVRAECDRINGILERVAPMFEDAGGPRAEDDEHGPELDEGAEFSSEPADDDQLGLDEDVDHEADEDAAIAVPASEFTPRQAPEPIAYEGTGRTELAEPPSEGIRLLATQMAVAGESVADIERRLRSDFGVADAHLVVRELFGPPS